MGDENQKAFLEATRRQLSSTYQMEILNGPLLSSRQQRPPPPYQFDNGNSASNPVGWTSLVGSGWDSQQLSYHHLPGERWMTGRPPVGYLAGGFQNGRGGDLSISRNPLCPVGSEFSAAVSLLRWGHFQQGAEHSLLSHPLVLDCVLGQFRSAPLTSSIRAPLLHHSTALPSIEDGVRRCEASNCAGHVLHTASNSVSETPYNHSSYVFVAESASRDATEDENEEGQDHAEQSVNEPKHKRPSSDPATESEKHDNKGPRRHRKPSSQRRAYNCEPFAQKLFRMITDQEDVGRKDVVEFLDGGGGFWLHDPNGVSELMPSYNFRGSKFSGFRRQLTSYGFRVEKKDGRDKGAYKNPLFWRGRPDLCRKIVRDDENNDKSDMGTIMGRAPITTCEIASAKSHENEAASRSCHPHMPRRKRSRSGSRTAQISKSSLDNIEVERQGCKKREVKVGRQSYEAENFVQKLFRTITAQEAVGKRDIVEFLDGGGGFWLHDPLAMLGLLADFSFRSSNFSNFHRQLNSYGFKQDKSSSEVGVFKNPFFLRDRPELCQRITRGCLDVENASDGDSQV